MSRQVFDPAKVLASLSKSRTIFHSEADLQHAFAWELQKSHPEAELRLEVPVRAQGSSMYLDLLARFPTHEVAIELKYKTRQLELQLGDELYLLRSHAAQDLGRYDFFRDVTRAETFSRSSSNRQGFAIFLTNDSAYWKGSTSTGHGYSAFALSHERDVEGTLEWGIKASDGTRRGREAVLTLAGAYKLRWQPYSKVAAASYREFRYLCVEANAA